MSASKKDQMPTGEGVRDVPSVPGTIQKYNTPKLQSVGVVPDRTAPESVKGGKS